jgi:glutamyl/glutaminyl-tRNA synthetase
MCTHAKCLISTGPIVHHESGNPYRGRIAPSPTGYLHLGHARTFWVAQQRAQANGGALVFRNDDLDGSRCKPEYVTAMFEDLRWFGFRWHEGPDVGGPFAPYNQSERLKSYRHALNVLIQKGFVYPCTCSRKDIQSAARAPHAEDDDEPIYPGTCRHKTLSTLNAQPATRFAWRFKVPDGETVTFMDKHFGPQSSLAGQDFGDFVVWRQDGLPSYQLACVADDAAMRITEVVRGADLLKSTARQVLLYRALELSAPAFYHCELVTDEKGVRLAKRHDALSLRSLREEGKSPASLQV